MKIRFCFLSFIFLQSLLFSACITTPKPQPKPLDLTSIKGEVPISSVNFYMRRDLDEAGIGKEFMRSVFIKRMGDIKKILAAKGVNIADGPFLADFDKNPGVEFNAMRISQNFVVNKYSWNSQNTPETRLEFVMSFALREDGIIPLDVYIKKDDPEYGPGYETKMTLDLKFR
ncbi:MAG: hypothetical protein LBC53_04000 [Spirochaetaceae bacterium]|jgi:hypothetical protein|nr:hypothetical protein [Spirochaetaceae bacterium]